MPKRSSKPRDANQMAKAIVDQATSDEPEADPYEGKNPAAVELGRLLWVRSGAGIRFICARGGTGRGFFASHSCA